MTRLSRCSDSSRCTGSGNPTTPLGSWRGSPATKARGWSARSSTAREAFVDEPGSTGSWRAGRRMARAPCLRVRACPRVPRRQERFDAKCPNPASYHCWPTPGYTVFSSNHTVLPPSAPSLPQSRATLWTIHPPRASNALDDPQPAPAQAPWTAGVREPRAGEFFGVVLDIDVQQTALEFYAQVDDPGTLPDGVRHQFGGQQGRVVDHLVRDAPTIEQPFKKRPPSGRRIWPPRHLGVSHLRLSVSPVHDLTPQSVGDAATKSPPERRRGLRRISARSLGVRDPSGVHQAGHH